MLLNAFRNHSAILALSAAGVQRQRAVRCEAKNDGHPSSTEDELKNGSKVPAAVVNSSLLVFTVLLNRNPLALYELIKKCKDDSHKLWVGTESVLKNLSLLDADGKVHESICDVLLSAVTNDGLDLAIGSPYKPKPQV